MQELAYYHCNDRVESCTALVEPEDGEIELVAFGEDASTPLVAAAATA